MNAPSSSSSKKLGGGMHNMYRRLLHTPSPRRAPARWLQRVLEEDGNNADPPKLYAWTGANLPPPSSRTDHHESLPTASSPRTTPSRDSIDDRRRRIYILGVGNIGRLYATSLAKLPDRPPITLVVHRRELLEHWAARPGIELTRDGGRVVDRDANFDVEWWTDAKPTRGPVTEPGATTATATGSMTTPTTGSGGGGSIVENLVVATKAADAMPQVDRVRRYLDGGSTVAFTQNGMCKLWPPLGAAYNWARFPGSGGRPSWVACVTTHGVVSLGPFRSVHASPADVLVGAVMPDGGGIKDGGSDYLVSQLVDAPGLAARRVSTRELWTAQLEKLVVNSVINPLTAVLRCKNGEIFTERDTDDLSTVIDTLVDEASTTLCALVMDSSSDEILADAKCSNGDADKVAAERRLQDSRKELLERFSFARLRAMLDGVGAKVAENTSSMLQDVRAGKQTEINDFNGWLVETAGYLDRGLRLPAHEKLIALVQAQVTLPRNEIGSHLLAEDRG